MKITNYKNTILCKELILSILNQYNTLTLPHLRVKKAAKFNETNMRAVMSFIAKAEDLDDAVSYVRDNAYSNGEVASFTGLLGKYSVNGKRSYHGINLAKIITEDYDFCLTNYVVDPELEKFIFEAFSEDGIAFKKQAMPSVSIPSTFSNEDFAEDSEEDIPNTSTTNDAQVENPTEESEDSTKPLSVLNTEEIKKELQNIAEVTLSGYQLVLQEDAQKLIENALESKKNEIIKTIEQTMLANQLPPVQITTETETYVIPGELHHEAFETVLKLVGAGFNLYLYSQAGIGKTHLVTQVAKALKMELYFMLPGNSIDLLGYEDAYGKFHETSFTKWAKNGGILYGSEFDANDASLILNLNTALANGYTVINGETVTLNKNCRFIADGNSKLTGATSAYAGRQRQDSSIIDRLMFVEMKNDYKLELKLSGNNKEWITFIKCFREAKEGQGSNMVVSLRATEAVLKAEQLLGINKALECGLLKGTNMQVIKAIADKLAIQLPNNKYAKALLEVSR